MFGEKSNQELILEVLSFNILSAFELRKKSKKDMTIHIPKPVTMAIKLLNHSVYWRRRLFFFYWRCDGMVSPKGWSVYIWICPLGLGFGPLTCPLSRQRMTFTVSHQRDSSLKVQWYSGLFSLFYHAATKVIGWFGDWNVFWSVEQKIDDQRDYFLWKIL